MIDKHKDKRKYTNFGYHSTKFWLKGNNNYYFPFFAQVSGNPTREQTEEVTSLWQTGLWNSHIQADRFLLEDDRAIFMFKVKNNPIPVHFLML